jgi:anion-transporting  ArsA/GET3 family ATPase
MLTSNDKICFVAVAEALTLKFLIDVVDKLKENNIDVDAYALVNVDLNKIIPKEIFEIMKSSKKLTKQQVERLKNRFLTKELIEYLFTEVFACR